jgi:catechol 2,3-dioxygenase
MTTHSPSPETPLGLNHLVLNVRDIEESHRFWTEILGFTQVGERRPRADGAERPAMRFYSGLRGGRLSHHDVALVERPDLASRGVSALDHVAIEMPDREAWLRQLAFLRARGITPTARVRRGVSHSVHITDPNGIDVEIMVERRRALWEGDIDAALNEAAYLPPDAAPEAAAL